MIFETDLGDALPTTELVATIGVFDGVHRGHLHLFRAVAAAARASGRASCVITLHPSPVIILRPGIRPAYLTSLAERLALIKAAGIDHVLVLRFTRELSLLDPRSFLEQLLARLRIRELWEGPDFALGHQRAGTIPVLRALGNELGFDVRVVSPLVEAGEVVSSTLIRHAVLAGDVARAAQLLGRPYRLSGEIVPGAQRGRTIGYPTANMRPEPERAIPANGIYVTRSIFGEQVLDSVTNIGTRPTFEDGEVLIEAFMLDFEGNLYGQIMQLDLLERIRAEERFETVEALLERMAADVAAARAFHRAQRSAQV